MRRLRPPEVWNVGSCHVRPQPSTAEPFWGNFHNHFYQRSKMLCGSTNLVLAAFETAVCQPAASASHWGHNDIVLSCPPPSGFSGFSGRAIEDTAICFYGPLELPFANAPEGCATAPTSHWGRRVWFYGLLTAISQPANASKAAQQLPGALQKLSNSSHEYSPRFAWGGHPHHRFILVRDRG